MSESQGRNRLIVTAQSLPAFQWGEKLLGSETTAVPGDPWVRTMCTTMMVLATMALILRQRFSNKIQPQKEDAEMEMPYEKSNGTTGTPE